MRLSARKIRRSYCCVISDEFFIMGNSSLELISTEMICLRMNTVKPETATIGKGGNEKNKDARHKNAPGTAPFHRGIRCPKEAVFMSRPPCGGICPQGCFICPRRRSQEVPRTEKSGCAAHGQAIPAHGRHADAHGSALPFLADRAHARIQLQVVDRKRAVLGKSV